MFGDNTMKWRFKCPSCGFVASAEDYKAAGAPHQAVGFSCVGRWIPIGVIPEFASEKQNSDGPCDYAGNGLFTMNPVLVQKDDGEIVPMFEFAPMIG